MRPRSPRAPRPRQVTSRPLSLNAALLLDASPNAIVGVDTAGTIRYANAQAEVTFGWPVEKLVGMSVEDLMPAATAARHTAFRAGYQHAPSARAMGVGRDLVASRRDGTEFPAEISLVPIEMPDGPMTFATIVDITSRRALEQQLLEARKSESIARLAGGIAHDFNNILTAVVGYADLARLETDRAAVDQDLEGIKAAADRASRLVRQLLAFGRRQILRPELLDVTEVVAGLESVLRQLAGPSVELTVVSDDSLTTVKVDRAQLEQVVMNLVSNASDAMPDGGRLVIGTESTHLDESIMTRHAEVPPGDYVLLSVSDSGAGMDEATLAHLFEPFFTTKEVGQGSGLGLATSLGIVRQSGGYIWAYSEPGHGSVFKVYLPAAVAREAESPRSKPRPGAGRRALVVEDDPTLRDLAHIVLSRAGFDVQVAADPEAALAAFEPSEDGRDGGGIGREERGGDGREAPAQRFDLLVSDVIMPGMSGPELARLLVARQPSLRVLLVSGYSADMLDVGDLEAVGFLAKPFSPAALLRAAGQALGESPPPGRAGD